MQKYQCVQPSTHYSLKQIHAAAHVTACKRHPCWSGMSGLPTLCLFSETKTTFLIRQPASVKILQTYKRAPVSPPCCHIARSGSLHLANVAVHGAFLIIDVMCKFCNYFWDFRRISNVHGVLDFCRTQESAEDAAFELVLPRLQKMCKRVAGIQG